MASDQLETICLSFSNIKCHFAPSATCPNILVANAHTKNKHLRDSKYFSLSNTIQTKCSKPKKILLKLVMPNDASPQLVPNLEWYKSKVNGEEMLTGVSLCHLRWLIDSRGTRKTSNMLSHSVFFILTIAPLLAHTTTHTIYFSNENHFFYVVRPPRWYPLARPTKPPQTQLRMAQNEWVFLFVYL